MYSVGCVHLDLICAQTAKFGDTWLVSPDALDALQRVCISGTARTDRLVRSTGTLKKTGGPKLNCFEWSPGHLNQMTGSNIANLSKSLSQFSPILVIFLLLLPIIQWWTLVGFKWSIETMRFNSDWESHSTPLELNNIESECHHYDRPKGFGIWNQKNFVKQAFSKAQLRSSKHWNTEYTYFKERKSIKNRLETFQSADAHWKTSQFDF